MFYMSWFKELEVVVSFSLLLMNKNAHIDHHFSCFVVTHLCFRSFCCIQHFQTLLSVGSSVFCRVEV